MRIHHRDLSDKLYYGLMMGIEIFNDKNVSVLKAGNFKTENSKWTEIKIEAGERLIGVKSGRRGSDLNGNYDVQFIVGKQV